MESSKCNWVYSGEEYGTGTFYYSCTTCDVEMPFAWYETAKIFSDDWKVQNCKNKVKNDL